MDIDQIQVQDIMIMNQLFMDLSFQMEIQLDVELKKMEFIIQKMEIF